MEIWPELEERGVILRNQHYVYASGKHGPHYVDMDPAFSDLAFMKQVCFALGSRYWNQVDTVVGAAIGGIPLAVMTAFGLGVDDDESCPAAIWADKVGDGFAFERSGFSTHLRNRRILVVEDVLNTADTVKKVIAQARLYGADIVGVSVVCNRGRETHASLGVPRLTSLANVDFKAFDPTDCPLCDANAPIVKNIGHGAKYQLAHLNYPGGFVQQSN